MNALTSLHAPTKSSLLVCEKIRSARDALFEALARRKSQNPILFGQIETEHATCESSEGDSESPQFFLYGQKSSYMMERMEYDFTKKSALISLKENGHYFAHLYQRAKTSITIITLEGDSVKYLCQSNQILNLKKWSIIKAHQQRRRGTQRSASAICYQPIIWKIMEKILLNLNNYSSWTLIHGFNT